MEILAVRTGITGLADALVSASVLLTAAIICAGAASADQSQQDQQDQFVAALEQDQIPLVDNLPALVARAHQICGELDGGTSIATVVNEEMNGIFEENPAYHQEFARVRRTAIRFIAVSAQVYCPNHLYDPLEGDLGSDVGFSNLDGDKLGGMLAVHALTVTPGDRCTRSHAPGADRGCAGR